MTSILRRLTALCAIAAVALLAAGCGGSSKSSTTASGSTSSGSNGSGNTSASCISTAGATSTTEPGSTVVGRSTSVVLFPSFAAVLKKGAITVASVPPASVTNTVLVFPISGGQIVAATFDGTLSHSGGLTFCHHRKSVALTDFVMNTRTKQVTATVGGKSLPIFDLDLASLKHAEEPLQTIVATNVVLTVTPKAGSALDSGLGVTTFKGGGQVFGVATLIVQVK